MTYRAEYMRWHRGAGPRPEPPGPHVRPEPWMADGACRQPEHADVNWFPGKGETIVRQRIICATCPVKSMCLEYALEHGERYGVWGGESERSRRRMRAKKRAA